MTDDEDQALARALLGSDRIAIVVVRCSRRLPRWERMPTTAAGCNLGRVYSWPDGSYRIAVRGWKARTQDFYAGRPIDPAGRPVIARDATYDIASDAGDISARCRHAGHIIRLAEVREAVEQARKQGVAITLIAERTFLPAGEPSAPAADDEAVNQRGPE